MTDTRPPINLNDPETLKRRDLTPEEHADCKTATFLERYGYRGTPEELFALKAMQGAGDSEADELVRRFNEAWPGVEALNAKFDAALLTATGRTPSEPELQWTPVSGSPLLLSDRAVTEACGAESLKELAAGDYARLEQRILAQQEGPNRNGDVYAPDALTPARNFMVQAEAAVGQMEARMTSLKDQLQAMADKHGLVITGLDNDTDQIGIGFPDGMAMEQQMAIAQELGSFLAAAPMSEQRNVSLAGQQRPQDQDQGRHRAVSMGASQEPKEQIRRVATIGRPRMGLAALAGISALLGVGMPGLGGYTPLTPAPQDPANRSNGEIGRVSPDLAYKLGKAGHKVSPGDMLKWIQTDFGLDIFAMAPGAKIGPIAVTLLPHKVQKRAALARPR